MSTTRLLRRSRPWRGLHRTGAALVSVAVVASLGLSACGSGGNELSKIKKNKTISIAMATFAPQDFQTNGQWTGYDVDILKAYAQKQGWKLKFDSFNALDGAVSAVATHRDDITIDIFYNKSRSQVIGFSRPMLNYNDAVAVNGTHPTIAANTVQAMSGKKIAVAQGSAEVAEAQKVPNANVQQVDNISDSFLTVSQGRADATFQPEPDIAWYQKTNPSLNIKELGVMPQELSPPIASLRGYFGVGKGSYSKSFLAGFNSYLKDIACNGQEQQILNNYGLSGPAYLQGICTAGNVYTGS